ncbi:serine/threonine-protein kinase [Deinococcus radiodurans]|uniref:Protein kinase, putative n=3 Tax=Deinococcus radiodurans TaxID=1299 RepID=Q9RYI0_DEIRA|nr:serine/threonine-protein kinase [Deinococcus radiodurans]AAF12449.1 protein kinase, putative [Deinococcus radiodurans R1 = ATCC 13939 = DSM 20539]ANC72843.1 protein kinase [Deinococcus radiodurans R1 = ATCC 13939 = DSM 20539]QEM73116.1 serine/threonine protein kinase [Deinococcus radiodurans]QIP30518.1 protein kinase [Deinococcus radiodurans]UDL02080.1 serine/threonine protein kinase [Deinococcus radiodurans R1 = ATCC 13939 = DSM 20539]
MTAPQTCPFCGSPAAPTDTVCHVCGAALGRGGATALLTLPPGTTLQGGQYVLDRVLGQGGFGITYDARDTRLGMRVAVKELFVDGSTRRGLNVIPPLSQGAEVFAATRRGFLEEAQVLARFGDPSIVRVLNYFEENGTAYLVMEFLEGETLGEAIQKRGPLPPLIAAQVADSVAHALEVVHAAGLLHRDIKPDNIFLHHSGRIILIDFGSVRAFDSGKTVAHTRLVTPGYAPLEQYSSAAKFGPYTDLYALGATLFHALTGQMPPAATDLSLGTPLPPLPPGTPPNLREAVLSCMAPRIENRPQSAQALRRILRGEGTVTVTAAPAAAPAPQPQSQPVRPSPAPTPTPMPNPQTDREVEKRLRELEKEVRKEARRQSRRPAPAPAPIPIPAPAPQRPAPPPTPFPGPRRPAAPRDGTLGRRLVVVAITVLSALSGGILMAQTPAWQIISPPELSVMAGAGIGALAGLALGQLLWWALPVALPIFAAAITSSVCQNLGYRPPTVIAASVAAIVVSLILMRLIRRI